MQRYFPRFMGEEGLALEGEEEEDTRMGLCFSGVFFFVTSLFEFSLFPRMSPVVMPRVAEVEELTINTGRLAQLVRASC